MTEPDLFGRLAKIKSSLEFARRFTMSPNVQINAMVQAEGDIEELLIDYGQQVSEEREPDRKVKVIVDYRVSAGSGHNGPYRNRTYEQAKELYDREKVVPSYFKAYEGQLQNAELYRYTILMEVLETNK